MCLRRWSASSRCTEVVRWREIARSGTFGATYSHLCESSYAAGKTVGLTPTSQTCTGLERSSNCHPPKRIALCEYDDQFVPTFTPCSAACLRLKNMRLPRMHRSVELPQASVIPSSLPYGLLKPVCANYAFRIFRLTTFMSRAAASVTVNGNYANHPD